MPLLSTVGVTVRYGGLAAVDGVTLDVERGSFVGLIGPNGAGKTTFVDAVSGITPSSGEISFEGQRLDRMPAHRRARMGLSRTFQSLELFEELTIWENLTVVAEPARWFGPIVDLINPHPSPAAAEAVTRSLHSVGLSGVHEALPAELSLGQRKLVTIARALSTSPKLALLDEPAAGLDSAESAELGVALKAVADGGTTIVMIDHDMGLVLGVCDVIHVMESGKLIASGTPAQIRTNDRVVHAYLGADASDLAGAPS